MDNIDIQCTCQDCGKPFAFTAGEQTYYATHDLIPPKRCKNCRENRRKERQRVQELRSALQGLHTLPKEAIPRDVEHTLFVIGNGFDKMHKVPSGYWDFQKTIGKQNPLRYALETYIKVDDLWADFEESLAHLDVGAMRNDATVDMWLDIFDAYNPNAHASDFYMAAETVMGPAMEIVRELPRRFRMWVESLSVQTADRPMQGIITNSKVLCFNYTEFIEDLYGVSHKNVCYIHGCRKKQKGHPKDKLILGHRPVWEYEGETAPRQINSLRANGRGNLMDAAYEAVAEYLIQYDQETTKDCASIIRAHQAFFDGLGQVQNIVVIGHSMSPVDWDYFIEINRRCPDAHWYASYYSADDVRKCKALMSKLGVDSSRFSLFAT